MVPGSARRPHQSAVDASAASVAAAMWAAADSLQARLELVLDERLGPLSADQRGFLQVARKDGQRLLKLIADLREIALAEAGLLELEWGRVDLADVTRQAATAAELRAEALGKRTTVSAGSVAAVAADAPRVQEAVRRLTEHAVQHSAPGSEIELRATPSGVAIRYEAEAPPPADSLALAYATAVAGAHGGSLTVSWNGTVTELDAHFAASDAPVVPIGVAA